MKFNCEQKAVVVVKHQQVLPTLRFSHEFGIVFLWSCGFFEDLLGPWFWACFFAEFCFVEFFSKFTALLLFQCTAKGNLDVFLCEFAHFELVFPISPPCVCFTCCCFHCFFNFPTKRIFDIFFRLNYLIWACLSDFLA